MNSDVDLCVLTSKTWQEEITALRTISSGLSPAIAMKVATLPSYSPLNPV